MSKELDEFYKKYSARIIAMDDTPLVKVMDGGKFKMLSIEEYEEMTNKISDLEAKLAESEKETKHWHDLYKDRDNQFQSVRQRYHLLNKLQSNYDKKDKLHLAYMQCAELVDENEKLKQQLAEKDKELEKYKEPRLFFSTKLDVEALRKQLNAEPCIVVGLDISEVKMLSPNQDKIELLKEVKRLFEEKYSYDVEECDFAVIYETDIDEIIDNQIKQLKEGK